MADPKSNNASFIVFIIKLDFSAYYFSLFILIYLQKLLLHINCINRRKCLLMKLKPVKTPYYCKQS